MSSAGESDGDKEKKQFKLNTNGCCLLCLRDVGGTNLKVGDINGYSISPLVQYLKINLRSVFTDGDANYSGPFSALLPLLDSSEISAQLCGECGKVSVMVSKQIKLLELLQMELSDSLEKVRGRILEANGNNQTVNQFRQRISSDIYTLILKDTIERLREQLLTKCTQIFAVLPNEGEVPITKMDLDLNICKAQLRIRPHQLNFQNGPIKIKTPKSSVSKITFKSSHVNDAKQKKEKLKLKAKGHSNKASLKRLKPYIPNAASSSRKPGVKNRKKCGVCLKVFSSRYRLNTHLMWAHVDDKLSKCSTCEELFQNPWDLKKHVKLVHSVLYCTFPGCLKTFRLRFRLNHHVAKYHPNYKNYESDTGSDGAQNVLEETPKKPSILKVETKNGGSGMERKRGPEKKCGGCLKSFQSWPGLQSHLRRKNCEGAKEQLADIRKNIDQRKQPSKRSYQCTFPKCLTEFQLRFQLIEHIARRHPGWSDSEHADPASRQTLHSKPIKKIERGRSGRRICKICRKSFKNFIGLNVHFRQSQCGPIMDDKYSSASNKIPDAIGSIATQKVIDSSPQFPCTFPGCSKTFSFKAQLNRHQIVRHPNLKEEAAKEISPQDSTPVIDEQSSSGSLLKMALMAGPEEIHKTEFDCSHLESPSEESELHPASDISLTYADLTNESESSDPNCITNNQEQSFCIIKSVVSQVAQDLPKKEETNATEAKIQNDDSEQIDNSSKIDRVADRERSKERDKSYLHLKSTPFRCTFKGCSRSFSLQIALLLHQRSQHPKEDKKADA